MPFKIKPTRNSHAIQAIYKNGLCIEIKWMLSVFKHFDYLNDFAMLVFKSNNDIKWLTLTPNICRPGYRFYHLIIITTIVFIDLDLKLLERTDYA